VGRVERQRPDDPLRRDRTRFVRADHRGQAQAVDLERLVVGAIERTTEVSAVDPAPLDVRQVMDDADERQQASSGTPPGLLVVESVDLAQHRTTQEAPPTQEQFTLVGGREVDLLVTRHR
jgi:hypothetical protein